MGKMEFDGTEHDAKSLTIEQIDEAIRQAEAGDYDYFYFAGQQDAIDSWKNAKDEELRSRLVLKGSGTNGRVGSYLLGTHENGKIKFDDILRCREFFQSLPDGHVWALPRPCLLFKKTGSSEITLLERVSFLLGDSKDFQQKHFDWLRELFQCAGINLKDLSDRSQIGRAQSPSKAFARGSPLSASALKEKLSNFFAWLVAFLVFAIGIVAVGLVGQLSVTKSLVDYCNRIWPLGFETAFMIGGVLWFVVRLGLRRAVWRYAWTIYRRKAGIAFIECTTVVIAAVALWAVEAALVARVLDYHPKASAAIDNDEPAANSQRGQ